MQQITFQLMNLPGSSFLVMSIRETVKAGNVAGAVQAIREQAADHRVTIEMEIGNKLLTEIENLCSTSLS